MHCDMVLGVTATSKKDLSKEQQDSDTDSDTGVCKVRLWTAQHRAAPDMRIVICEVHKCG